MNIHTVQKFARPYIKEVADDLYYDSHHLMVEYDWLNWLDQDIDSKDIDLDDIDPKIFEYCYCPVRLQVIDNDHSYNLHYFDSQFDTDSRGYWASGYLRYKMTKRECRLLAKELIREVEDDFYMSQD